jgi:hypothetical protein
VSQTAGFGARRKPGSLLTAAVVALLLGGGLLLTGCGGSLARTPRMSDAWSKGLPLGLASLNNRTGLAVEKGGSVCVVWVGQERDLRFVRLDDRAHVEIDRALDLETNRPQQPLLALDGEGYLHLTWLDTLADGLQLFYARLSPDGETLQNATVLSSSPLEASRTAMAIDPLGGTVEVFWSDMSPSRSGLYHAALDGVGTIVLPQELLIPDGLWPAAQIDNQGFVHLAWQTKDLTGATSYHYAVYDPQDRALGPSMVVLEPGLEPGLLGRPTARGRFDGPWLGLEDDFVYLTWVLEVREQGSLSAFTFYQAFPLPPLQRPVAASGFTYPLPQVTAPPVHVQGADPTVTGDPVFLPGRPARQALAFYTLAQGPRNQEMLQSGVVELQGGQVLGQEVVSATSAASLKPAVAADGQGYLHLVWIDTAGFNRYQVVYASTAPQAQEVLNRVTAGEVLDSVLSFGMGAVSLFALAPLALLWVLPPFLLLVFYFLATQQSDLEGRRSYVVLAVAILVLTAIQVGTTAGVTEGALGSTLPSAMRGLSWLIPLLTSGVAVGVMLLSLRRTDHRTIFGGFLVYAAVNVLLFALVYLVPAVM